MSKNNELWTAPTESESGKLIMVTGFGNVDKFRTNGRYSIRVEITWKYDGGDSGMPDVETSTLMEEVQNALSETFRKDPVAVLTGIYTGDGERNWVFYTTSTHIFGRKLNEALSTFELLPITIYTENDPEWNEYAEMKELSEIMQDDD